MDDICGDACKEVSNFNGPIGLEIKEQVLHHVRLHVKVPG